MAIRKNSFAKDEYYHLYSRGVDKRTIFLDSQDEKRFIRLLFLCNGSVPIIYRDIKELPLVSVEKGECVTAIGAYCLMPNHFHLLVRETTEGGISAFMHRFSTAYTMYFNIRWNNQVYE